MWWIILGVGVVGVILGAIFIDNTDGVVAGLGCTVVLIAGIALPISYYNCYKITNTIDKQIEVIEQRNLEVCEQIEPIINRYLEYETNTYEKAKPSADSLVAYTVYPNIKGDEFLMKQINIVLDNQKQITELKMKKAEANKYGFLIFKRME